MPNRLFLAGVALLALPTLDAAANPLCSSLPDPIVVAGSSAMGPFIKGMGTVLAGQTTPTTLVYQKQGSCTGVNAIINDTTPTAACANGACITGTATYYDPTGAALSCDLATTGTHVDVGVSDVYADTCTGLPVPAGVAQFSGPIQAMLFITPKAQQGQVAITAEEAYFVFGFGAAGQAMPWTVEAQLFVRNALSGTQQMIAHEVAVPAGRWKGLDKGGSQAVVDAVAGSTSPDTTLGIVSSDFYDAHRDTLKSLAFQAFHQHGAFYADSTATSFDKKNVRDGHYTAWGALQLLTHVTTGTTTPTTSAAKRFVDWVTGNTGSSGTAAPFNITDVAITANTIPPCAMHVTRASQGGAIARFTPTTDCSTYYESKVAH